MSKDSVLAAHGSLNRMLIAVCYQVVTYPGSAVAAFLLLPRCGRAWGAGLGLLLLYGGAMMLILTAGMLCTLMFHSPTPPSGSLAAGFLGTPPRLVRHEAQTREKLARQMDACREGRRSGPT